MKVFMDVISFHSKDLAITEKFSLALLFCFLDGGGRVCLGGLGFRFSVSFFCGREGR